MKEARQQHLTHMCLISVTHAITMLNSAAAYQHLALYGHGQRSKLAL